MDLIQILSKKAKICEEHINELNKKIESLPAGSLRCYRSKGYYTWVHLLGAGVREVIRKNDHPLATALAEKARLIMIRDDLEAEVDACRAYIESRQKSSKRLAKNKDIYSEEFERLIAADNKKPPKNTADWENAPYQKYDGHPEQLKIRTNRGEKVRSKLEAMVANILFRLEIPYRYEQVYTFSGELYVPDFTVLDVRTGGKVLIECFGLMERPDYRESFIKKIDSYVRSGVTPGVDFLAFFETDSFKLGEASVESRIRHHFF